MTGFDDPRGQSSEDLAFRAEQATRSGDLAEASSLFAQAAELETAVARDVPAVDHRVRGVLAVSATALWYKAKRYDEAQQVAYEFLAEPYSIDAPSIRELKALLERCWRDEEAAQLAGSANGFEPLEIKLAGGEIQTGFAPAAEVRARQTLVGALLIRTAEWLAKKPFRARGEANGTSTPVHIDVERFEESAREKLNKLVKVVVEERPSRRGKGKELHALDLTLRDERDELPWVQAARSAVKQTLDDAEWEHREGVVLLMMRNVLGEPIPIEIENLDELLSELEDIATNAWQQHVPRDGGVPVFAPDTEEIVDSVLDGYPAQLAAMGWRGPRQS